MRRSVRRSRALCISAEVAGALVSARSLSPCGRGHRGHRDRLATAIVAMPPAVGAPDFGPPRRMCSRTFRGGATLRCDAVVIARACGVSKRVAGSKQGGTRIRGPPWQTAALAQGRRAQCRFAALPHCFHEKPFGDAARTCCAIASPLVSGYSSSV